jgi:hypothetical protein
MRIRCGVLWPQLKTCLTKNDERGETTALNTQPPAARLVYGVHQSAERLSCSPGLIRKLIRQGRLTRIPGVRKILIPDASLQEFAASAE